MSAPDQNAYQNWFKSLPIPWLVAGVNGQAEANTWPAQLDAQVAALVQARYQAYPDYCSVDALPNLGNDRGFIQGSAESNANFQTRLKYWIDTWNRAGTWATVLEQLYWFGLSGAVIVQQNGLSTTLSGAPTAGQDPTSLAVDSTTTALAATLTSSVAPYRTIPAGTPWVNFDGNTDMTNRFAIILPNGFPFARLGFAYFNNTTSATVVWPVPFPSTTYNVIFGAPTAPVVLTNDGTSQTKTSVTILASGAWTGVIPVIGWVTGQNPFNTFSSASVGALQKIIQTWRPNAICMGVYAYGTASGAWGYPVRKWQTGGDKWGATAVTQVIGSF